MFKDRDHKNYQKYRKNNREYARLYYERNKIVTGNGGRQIGISFARPADATVPKKPMPQDRTLLKICVSNTRHKREVLVVW